MDYDSLGSQLTLQYTNGLAWILTFTSLLIVYAYLISNQSKLWKILFIMAVSQLISISLENFFRAKGKVSPNENWAVLMLIDQFFLFTTETCIIVYSVLKLQIILNETQKKYLKWYQLVSFLFL